MSQEVEETISKQCSKKKHNKQQNFITPLVGFPIFVQTILLHLVACFQVTNLKGQLGKRRIHLVLHSRVRWRLAIHGIVRVTNQPIFTSSAVSWDKQQASKRRWGTMRYIKGWRKYHWRNKRTPKVHMSPLELWFLFLLIWLDVRTASAKSSATLPPCKTFLTRAILLTWTSASFRELPRTLCFHKCDSFASAATRFASAKPCPVPSPLHVLQVSMSFRGKKLQKCFRELPRVEPEAHFSCLMSKSWLVLFK